MFLEYENTNLKKFREYLKRESLNLNLPISNITNNNIDILTCDINNIIKSAIDIAVPNKEVVSFGQILLPNNTIELIKKKNQMR